MSSVAAILAQLVHGALMLAAAPLVLGLCASAEAWLAGWAAPPPWQAWRALIRLSRKQAAVAESASPLAGLAGAIACGAMLLAALLVPSFTTGMIWAPAADLLAIAGLVTLARMGAALAALDPGTASAGLAAARVATLGCLAEPALFLALLALGLAGGTTNLDVLIGLQRAGVLSPLAASVLAAASLAVLAVAVPDTAALTAECSGIDLALADMTEGLRLLVWIDLIGGLFLPLGMAGPEAGLFGWGAGLLAWMARVVLLVLLLAGLRRLGGTLPLRRLPQASQVAAVLGLLAALLVLAGAVVP